MPVRAPGRRLYWTTPLAFVRKRAAGGVRRPVSPSLPLTSMIDVLVVTLAFLLLTFDASGANALEKHVAIPAAANGLDLVDAPIVSVTQTTIVVDGAVLGGTRAIERGRPGQRIDELSQSLKALHDRWRQVHPAKEFPGVVILRIDANVQAIVVKSVVRTAAVSGYPNVSFAVDPQASDR